MEQSQNPPPPASRQENLWLNLGFNLLIPILLLSHGSRWLGISPELNLVLALSFPLGYGLRDFIRLRKANFFSILGLLSIVTKGGIGLLGLDKSWVAVNEAALPFVFAVATLATVGSRRPLVKIFLFSESVFDVARIQAQLVARQTEEAFATLLRRCTLLLAGSFLLSSVLNYLVALWFIRTDPKVDLEAFNREMGAMQGWSYLIIVVPSMAIMAVALWVLVRGLRTLTGLSFEEALRPEARPPAK